MLWSRRVLIAHHSPYRESLRVAGLDGKAEFFYANFFGSQRRRVWRPLDNLPCDPGTLPIFVDAEIGIDPLYGLELPSSFIRYGHFQDRVAVPRSAVRHAMRSKIADGRSDLETIFSKGGFQTESHRLLQHGSRASTRKYMAVYFSRRSSNSGDSAPFGHVTGLARFALLGRPALVPVGIDVGAGNGGWSRGVTGPTKGAVFVGRRIL